MVEFITMAPTSGDSTLVGLANNSTNLNSWTGVDGNTERPPTLEYIKAIAQAAEKNGFSTLLLPTGAGCLDSLAVAANLIAHTNTLKFLFAIRPGFIAPTTFAKQFATVDYWSGGRALVNIVTGGSPIELASEGDYLDHDTRYKRTREYIQILKKLFSEESVDYHGNFFSLKGASLFPKPVKNPQIYFGGASEIAKEVAAEEVDVYMMWGETLENTRHRIEEMKQKSAKYKRNLSFSVSFQIILGKTEEEAWKNTKRLINRVSTPVLEKKEELIVKGDSIGAQRLHQLMKNSKENNFKIGPNLWAGLTQVLSGNSIALVGTPDQIAEQIVEFVELGFDKVLLRGFPHLETIEQLGELVIPKVHKMLKQKQLA
ncbi:MAG: LLM class flavin-dependent oxidoreductase [Heyndrickxia oleronia]|jgi:alkanesulfonate monooxygenase|uniref:LLM class flavin-dependent oxidoreductase n=1 Tax=Heyndrickxia oleronia TaxID=38875 RepID=UPI0024331BD6|nr:LLM class flavin-dependent oxidoreductase [Heyndrickxia oleronia]MCI1593587.1 LLM class flavin-dependent oxidoreductase [Heyndrickxia oleronia]